jgi:hypothetical protein
MPKQRIHFPETLPGAAEFSGHANLNDPAELVRAFKAATPISAPLIEAGEAMAVGYGRPRMSGSWVLVAVGFIASRQGDIQPFHDRASVEFWRECGFEGPPSYSTAHVRLTELEQLIPEIEEAVGRLVQQYMKIEPRIGRHVYVDGTEAETHSRFYHDCMDADDCAWRREGETADEVNMRVFGRATTEAAQRRRQQEDAGEVEGEAEETVLAFERTGCVRSGLASSARAASDSSERRPLHRVKTSNHHWLTHDPDAGFRSYRRPNGKLEGWHGYYHFAAVDLYTGLPLFGLVASSSRAEHSQYEEILRGVIRSMNGRDIGRRLDEDDLSLTETLLGSTARRPEAIIGDRGFAYPFIYEQNTRLGIQTVAPWRKFGNGRDQPKEIVLEGHDGLPFIVDRDGVTHCKHCGGPTHRSELRLASDQNPRIYVKCLLPSAPDSPCQKLQSVSCALDWRMLTELTRNDPRYLALESFFQLERSHQVRRVRNRSGGKGPLLRPKRLGRAWQQFQLSMGTLIDWFRAGLKNGWLQGIGGKFKGYSAKVTKKMKEATARLEEQVAKKFEARRLERQRLGLDRCLPTEPERPPPKPPK